MFITLPVGMNYRTERLPVMTFSLIGANTLIYVVSLVYAILTEGESDLWVMQNLWLIPIQSNWWMYLTSMFVHAGILHLLGNMIYLFLFGACVEDILGRARFLGFYLASGIVSELTFIAFTPAHFMSHVPMGGASGAIMGCLGMYLLLRADADIDFKYWYFFLFWGGAGSGEFAIPAWMAISFWFLKDLFWAVLGFVYKEGGGGVAFGAHVGGFVAGLAFIGLYKLFGQRRELAEEKSTLIIDPTQAMLSVAAARRKMEPPARTNEQPTIFLHDGAEQTGPFTLTQVQSMLEQGTINREASYWSEGMSDWQNVADLAIHYK
jgi:membrane associated rhomboid family serine protease